MSALLDHFVDTREKRSACLFCVTMVLGLCIFVPYLYLAWTLLKISSYADVFALLQDGTLQMTYCSRVILRCLSMAQFDLKQLLLILLTSFRFWEVCAMGCWMVFLQNKARKKLRFIFMFACLALLLCVGVCVYFGFQSTSLMQAMLYVTILAGALFIFSFSMSAIMIVLLWYQAIPSYKEALQYEVIELKE